MISNKSQVLGYDATAMQPEAVLLVKMNCSFPSISLYNFTWFYEFQNN